MEFNLKRPCKNCLFLPKDKAIDLHPGRLAEIVDHLKSDFNVFPCHKTTHRGDGDYEEDPETGEEVYIPSGVEEACMGALVYMYRKHNQFPILARLATQSGGDLKERIRKCYPLIVEDIGDR